MGFCRNISTIFMIGALSLYGTEAQMVGFWGPVVGDATPVGEVTKGVDVGVSDTTAAVTIPENTVNSDGVITTVVAYTHRGGIVTYTIHTPLTIFQVNAATGAITVAGTYTASASGSPYTFLVEATEVATVVTGTLKLTITVEGSPTTSPPTLPPPTSPPTSPPTTSPPTLPPTTSPPTTCLLTGDTADSLTTLSTYSTSTESGETTTYTLKMLTQSSKDSWTQQQQISKHLCYLGFMTARSPIQAQLMRLCLHGNYYPSMCHDWTPEK